MNASKTPQNIKDYIRRWRAATPRHCLGISINSARKRFYTKNPVTTGQLMEMWTKQKGICAVTGLSMTWGGIGNQNGKIRPTSVSIDRRDSKKGYTRANVRLVCYRVNVMKGNMLDREFLSVCRMIVKGLS